MLERREEVKHMSESEIWHMLMEEWSTWSPLEQLLGKYWVEKNKLEWVDDSLC